MTDLKTKIARGEYQVDSRQVAGSIIGKVQTVNRVRRQLEGSRGSPSRGRFDRVASLARGRRRATA